jgi:hypothetical protein
MNHRIKDVLVGTRGPIWCRRFRASLILLLISQMGFAQGIEEQAELPVVEATEVAEEVVVDPVMLPDSRQMAVHLATPELRKKALLDLAVAESVLQRAGLEVAIEQGTLAQQFHDDRDWLQLMVDRYGWVEPRSAILDPAAWLVFEELQQHEIEEIALVFPGRTAKSDLIHQVFQRAGERLAVANLPFLLLEVEPDAIASWDKFLELVTIDELIDPAWEMVESAWFKDQGLQSLPVTSEVAENAEASEDAQATELSKTSKAIIDSSLENLSRLVSGMVFEGPPNALDLVHLRYSLFEKMLHLDAESQLRAGDILYLASLINGLQDGRYIDFAVGLLAITSRLLANVETIGDSLPLVEWLVAELPDISALHAVHFANIDPRLNTVMTVSHSLLRDIAVAEDIPVDVEAARIVLADVVAQLMLLIPDMAFYFDTPVRSRIIEQVTNCISIAISLNDDEIPSMTRTQFDACMTTLLQLANSEIRLAELSGNMNGPFSVAALRRELSVVPWQRVNYGIGYLHESFPSACQAPAKALPNPLEWAVLATTMAWFAESAPVFFRTPENETHLAAMRSIGEQLMMSLAEQTACLAASGSGMNDIISRGMTNYELALRDLESGITDAEAEYRGQNLKPGADAQLSGDAQQGTGYRPENLLIEPCNSQSVCEMSGSLSTTRALIGLFPDEYLIAEQTGLGEIEICYRDMEWVQRRSELVRPDDENVANYFGHLGFDLVGRYVEKDQVNEVFGFRFTSPKEEHYLFAQTSDEVLNDSCPVEWVGSRVVTPLREERNGIVPNRLTYLAASRKLPSRLLQNNWDRGAEWRDWFVTGIGVTPLDIPPAADISTRLDQHLQSLYQAEQVEIYQRLRLASIKNSQGDETSLLNEMSSVSISKSVMKMQMMLFYPESLSGSDTIRKAITGDDGLLEERTLRRLRNQNVALTSVNDIAQQRLDELRKAWQQQPEVIRRQGSTPASLMHALTRINILYRQFFTAPPVPLQEMELIENIEAEVE